MDNLKTDFLITQKDIVPDKWLEKLKDPSCGGEVTFTGKVRLHHEGKEVSHLSYEAYKPMAEKVFQEIIEEAKQKFGVHQLIIIHRVGKLEIGDIAVWIGAAAAHRKEAFEACHFAIDTLKQKAPIWKKETYVSGESQWVDCSCAHENNLL